MDFHGDEKYEGKEENKPLETVLLLDKEVWASLAPARGLCRPALTQLGHARTNPDDTGITVLPDLDQLGGRYRMKVTVSILPGNLHYGPVRFLPPFQLYQRYKC